MTDSSLHSNSAIEAQIERASAWTTELTGAMGAVLVGQKELTRSLTLGLLAGGHILLEGVPGLAKSLGKSVTLFKKGLNDVQDEVKDSIENDEKVDGGDNPPLEG